MRGFTTTDDMWRLPLQPSAVDPIYLTMLTAYEDQRFAWHPGVDPLAVVRAIGQWIRHGRIVSGASTLTMQVARLLEPHPRTVIGKLQEMLRALQLEWRYDKDTLLSWYLTLAPYGGNLEGLRSASLAYLGKEPLRLTPAEAALLVSLPQAPSRLRPDRFPERARLARDKVLHRIGRLGVLTAQQIAEAQQEALPNQRRSLPFHAPHLARRLHKARPAQPLHHTFIDGPLQRTIETLARQHPLPPYNNLAILVAENRSQQVIAYLGSVDFFATPRAGQICYSLLFRIASGQMLGADQPAEPVLGDKDVDGSQPTDTASSATNEPEDVPAPVLVWRQGRAPGSQRGRASGHARPAGGKEDARKEGKDGRRHHGRGQPG
ncbi:MAG: penicillin-binding protein 1C, partial [Candidatus Competibacteraceae bacterium]|nr:penicillin-binding protein 1C [Candidatus Competibacteraceae bacterium]